ncbi:MAG TPA: 6-phosphogluconolactonase [Thermoanaerobaculia bacterium]|nr:6-phosphogluconolactonase [Thermoanaerobaculia bacterium]
MNRLPEEGPPNFEVRVLPDADEAARAAALEIFHAAANAIGNRGVFRIALSGGTTPVRLFRLLADPPFRERAEWSRARFFFVDERCVPPEDARSNYRLAKEHLLDPLGVLAEHVFRMRGENEPAAAARAYEDVLTREFGSTSPVPRLDVSLLGVGGDGHTASLFPGTAALEERERLVSANWVPKLNEWRLTLTVPVLNASRWDVFLVTGAEKSAVVASAVEQKDGSREPPASLVRPRAGSLIWILDQEAAAVL